jgi:alanine racemase
MKSTFKGRPTFCSIDIGSLCWNFRQAKKKVGPGVRILSVVKANAYGHGEREVATALESEGTNGLGVATLEEGVALRRSGISSPILVLSSVLPKQLDGLFENHLTPVISEGEGLRELEEKAQRRELALPFHLKVDTGMGRIGFLASETATWLPKLKNLKALRLEGILSHFADAERFAQDTTRRQLDSFHCVLQQLEANGVRPALVHLANSAAVISIPAAHFTMVRPGLMLYGLYPTPKMVAATTLKPVLSWKT